MKKLVLIAMAAAAAMSLAVVFAAVPELPEPPAPPDTERVGIIEKYVLKDGVIKDVRESSGMYSLLISGDTIPFLLTLDSEAPVLDASDCTYKAPGTLAPGMEISVACEGGPGMARYINSVKNPAAVIIKSGKEANLSVFDADYTAYDLSLKLIMSESVPVYDLEGGSGASKDITLKEALVIYRSVNGCFPPETEPDCVLILRDLAE